MAKFLPFVVEKSTPNHIYQTLISRSKGANMVDVTSVFLAVLSKGIKKIRKFTSDLPDLPLEKVYVEILNKYPQYRVSTKYYQRIQSVGYYADLFDSSFISDSELEEYSLEDQMGFLLAIILYNEKLLSDYTKLPFTTIFDDEEIEIILTNLKPHGLFSTNSKIMEFSNKEDLTSYIIYATMVSPEKLPPIEAKYHPLPKKSNSPADKDENSWVPTSEYTDDDKFTYSADYATSNKEYNDAFSESKLAKVILEKERLRQEELKAQIKLANWREENEQIPSSASASENSYHDSRLREEMKRMKIQYDKNYEPWR